jgi:polysaccharide pyruvyl transferase WcaK-like protein
VNGHRQPSPRETSVAAAESPPIRIGLISPYSGSNLGDTAILEGTIRHIERRLPSAKVFGLTLDPVRFRAIHGHESVDLTRVVRPFYYSGPSVAPRAVAAGPAKSAPVPTGNAVAEEEQIGLPKRVIRGVLRMIPGAIPAGRAAVTALRRVQRELSHLPEAAHIVKSCDLLIVAGGGQLDEEFGGPWGHPYTLAKWSYLARRYGRPFVLCGVGVCELHRPLARTFARSALKSASSVTLRDQGSLRIVSALAPRVSARVCSDLALLMTRGRARVWPQPLPASLTIGVSPIAYGRQGSWPGAKPGPFERYLAELIEFVRLTLRRGHRVRLFCTDDPDRRVADQVLREAKGTASLAEAAIDVVPRMGVDEHLDFMGSLDLVVASRLHALILSHVASTPAVAVSYSRKVDAHMDAIAQTEFCIPFSTVTAAELDACVERLADQLQSVSAHVESRCVQWQSAAAGDLDSVLSSLAPKSAVPVR